MPTGPAAPQAGVQAGDVLGAHRSTATSAGRRVAVRRGLRRVVVWMAAAVLASFAIAGPAGARVHRVGETLPEDTTTTTTTTTTIAEPPPAPAPEPPPPPPPPPDPTAKWINHLHIDLAHQRVNVIANDGTLLRSMPASTGANGRTPRGNFAVYSKSPWTTASSSGAVTMQWMTRIRGGIGFHAIPRKNGRPMATPLGIAPVSHGCIRLSDEDAAWVYMAVPIGTRVVVK